ncbi:siderophore-interacting protein [Reinekea blandensis]|uniref:Vibriobactin utilization protein ViuB n=1 Tax=Reinekea blandensis MED297 TaxID=314283 RepID=A4BFX9_9GAMM|nr:siderophore-interacting protein [Reinekea blandensis]EAR08997.1 vibriobactin utilization protein ViuB [Reinekea sp. MED297] [Reinekea blandensis MED297]
MGPLTLTVVRSQTMSTALKRLVLTGEGLQRIPEDNAGLHIKLFFKTKQQSQLVLPERDANGKIQWPAAELKPIARTYSIAGYDRTLNELAVDFVLHDAPGPAADFARQAQPGDTLGFAGPGPITLYHPKAQHFLLVGDLSATPALSAVANEIHNPDSLTIYLDLPHGVSEDDIRRHYFPAADTQLTCVFSGHPSGPDFLTPIQTRLQNLPPEQTSLTLAGEHNAVVALRTEARRLGFTKPQLYAVPYWRHTMNEETYHAERHAVMDN